MSRLPQLFTRNLSGLSQTESADASSPAEQRDHAKQNFLKTMRPLPTQHYWNIWFDRYAAQPLSHSQPPQDSNANPTHSQNKDKPAEGQEYHADLEQLGTQIESVQDFWRYENNTPVDQIKMRESIYLFKSGFRPVWEDRRNFNGGSWTFRVPKSQGPDMWTRIQLLAIGEVFEAALDDSKFAPDRRNIC